MRFVAIVSLLIAACSPCDDGDEVVPCTECSPGALRRGRTFEGLPKVAVSPRGEVVRTCGINSDHVAWLRADFTTEYETEITTENPDGEIVHLAVNDANEVAAVMLSLAEVAEIYEGELAVYESDGTERWRKQVLGNTDVYEEPFVAIGPRRVFMNTRFTPVRAYDAATGEVLWSLMRGVRFAADPTGGLIVSGGFKDVLDLGGTAPVLTASDTASYVAKFDDDGVARWAFALTGASVTDIAVSSTGEVAFGGRWTGPEVTIADKTIEAIDGETHLFAALVDPGGTLRFVHALGPASVARFCSVATDGNELIVAGTFEDEPLRFDADARTPIDVDAFVASFTAPGLGWLRIETGLNNQAATFGALSAGVVGYFSTSEPPWSAPTAARSTTLAELVR